MIVRAAPLVLAREKAGRTSTTCAAHGMSLENLFGINGKYRGPLSKAGNVDVLASSEHCCPISSGIADWFKFNNTHATTTQSHQQEHDLFVLHQVLSSPSPLSINQSINQRKRSTLNVPTYIITYIDVQKHLSKPAA
jgi:hypothetical protein